jgi:NADH dehydrogenase [ubiquinone] 1 alpha subcomplex assembly factor 7
MAENPIERLIAQEGAISVERFMELAASAYYAKGTAFGRAGDFTTAPEISQVFGELIGAWCCCVWDQLGRPDPFHLVELGPGRGTLMADLLRAAKAMPGFLTAARIHLVETSLTLRQRQKEALTSFDIRWHDDPATVPDDAPALILANEFLDALPIRQYVKSTKGWHQRLVTRQENGLLTFGQMVETDPAPPLADFVLEAPPGSIAEVCPDALGLIARLAGRIKTTGGAALFIDYGPLESGPGDSLQALKHHAFAPVLEDPGEADITAHVDFAALARRAAAEGLAVYGPVPQGIWLQRLGIQERTRALAGQASSGQAELLQSGTRRLIAPQEMGTLFKVLAISPPGLPLLPGFEVS